MHIATNYHLKPLSPHIRHTAFVRKLLFFLVNICVFCNLSAQTLPLSGTILDEKEECIPGVYLIAVNPKTSEVLATTTSSTDGKYVLPTIPLPFILNATHIGYTSLNIPINNKTDMETARILRMQVAIDQLQEVVVTAEPPHIEREIGKFVIRNIAASTFATGSNTYNFLRFMPMIGIKPEGGISILGKNDANIHINGRSVGDNQMAEQMLKGIPANEIARIEIIPVTGSTQSAENRNGIINVVLKKKPDEGLRVFATIEDRQGYYNSPSGIVFMNYAGKRVDLTAGITTSYNQLRQESNHSYNYLQTGLSTQSDFRERTRTLNAGGYINLNYNISDHHKLGAQISLGGLDYRKNSSSTSSYGRINSDIVDSIYTADVITKSPAPNLTWGANLNYVFKTDNEGSRLNIDLDFKNNSNKRNINNTYRKDYLASSVITDDFSQRPSVGTIVYGGRAEYEHCFNSDNTLQVGLSGYRGTVDNDFFYGLRSGDDYVSDAGRTNRFIYKDYNLAGYINCQRVWSETLETEIGLRAEKYHAKGSQKTTSETVTRNEFDIFPTLSILYMPSDDHELSLDFTSSIMRPYYGQLNPFITYTSPSTYIQNNPNLKSSKGYELMFSYTLFDDYMLTVDYLYDKDLWTDFVLPIDDMTRTYTDNYGNSHALDISLFISQSLFKNYWNFSVEAAFGYVSTRGAVSNRKIDFNDLRYGVTVKSNLALSKKYNWYLDLKYQYSSKRRAAAFDIGATHDLEIYILKQFRRASLSAGVYNILKSNITITNTFSDYRFSITNKRDITGVVTFSYTFGNQRARRVEKRQNSNIEKRMQ